MPSLTINDVNQILEIFDENITNYNVFVETGTYLGETILNLQQFFDKSYTIELSETLYKDFNLKDYDREKIISLLGDSSKVLSDVVKLVDDKTIFFLDGHYSSCGTAQGEKDVPLIEELLTINEQFNKESIIIIDDFRLFNTKLSEDWSEITLESVRETIKNRLVKETIINDRLVFHIR